MPGAPMAESPSSSSAAWCVFYGAGIICTLVVYGILQEGIMTVAYDGTLFRYSVFLVLCNRLAAVAFAVAMAIAKGESMKNEAPLWKYLVVSLSNVYASSCQYEALKYVSFAVQMLGKSFKMMPVMIWGMIISGKSYSARDWMIALSVTLGCTEFLMTGPTHSKVDANNSFKGFLLLGGFLALDGLTSTFQEKLFKEHKTTKYNQMLYINLLSATVSMVTLLVTGELWPAAAFGFAHPRFWLDCGLLSASAVGSQFFIYSQIKEFGALVFAATMNVRQVVSILVSYVKYHNPVTHLQVLGLCLIFSALFYKSIAAMINAPSKDEKTPILADQKAGQWSAVQALHVAVRPTSCVKLCKLRWERPRAKGNVQNMQYAFVSSEPLSVQPNLCDGTRCLTFQLSLSPSISLSLLLPLSPSPPLPLLSPSSPPCLLQGSAGMYLHQ
ncbi:slc35b2 [Symbiodinium necroappetens]|uniref:Slc35b2 protein n=1 Tax=Symbiodinium necroappetens TaxID=1628268 RepID=A0A813AKT8_9DINO|nr:slc35b2 [Symbiodinium necroappetens]